jgi:hypothetical protein
MFELSAVQRLLPKAFVTLWIPEQLNDHSSGVHSRCYKSTTERGEANQFPASTNSHLRTTVCNP